LFPRTYSVQLKDMGFTNRTLSTILTTGPNAGEAYDANWFRRGKPVKPSHKNGETYFIKVPPQSIMTITTLDTSWVNGVETFSRTIPSPERLPLPYQDTFRYREDEIMVRGCAPRYTTDQGGAFELIHSDQDGDILCQRIKKGNIPANWRFRGTPEPITCLGDDRWRSYSAEIEVRLDNRDAENYAGLGVRYNSAITCETSSRCGYTGVLYGDGRWQLLDMDNVAAEGTSYTVRATDWNKLKLLILGDSIFFFLNGDLLTTYRPQCPINSGRISLCSDYEMNTFRNLKVVPMPILPLYVRRVDCFSEEIFYNDYWDICTTESCRFYHRTSMKAQPQAAFSCQFTGSGIAVIGTAKNAEFQVMLDGEVLYETLFVPYCAPRQACLTMDQLKVGTHTLQMTLKSGEFKLDVLEVPENYTLMPDILTVTTAAQSSAEEHAFAIKQKELAKKKAAADAERTLQQAVQALQPEPEPQKPKEEPKKAQTFKEMLEAAGMIPSKAVKAAAAKEEQSDSQGVTVMDFPLPNPLDERNSQNKPETPVVTVPFSGETVEKTPVPEHLSESIKISPEEPQSAAVEKTVATEETTASKATESTEEPSDPTTMTYIEEEWENFSMPPQPEVSKSNGKTAPQKKAITPTPSPAPKAEPLHPPVLNDATQSKPYRQNFNIDIDI
ncbi:MAG: hypothetical protein ACI4TG_09370, partial [Ruminococcus sp.]